MRKPLFHYLLPLLLLASCNVDTSPYLEIDELESQKPTILIFHPTVRNLETVRYLTSEGIFPLPDDIRVIGVYHAKASYNYAQSADFIVSEGLAHYHLFEIKSELSPDILYGNNAITHKIDALFNSSNGALFFGGPDMPPTVYGKPTNLLTVITDVNRHYLELTMLFHMLGGHQDTLFVPLLKSNPKYNVLGLCLGMQSMNVATGGTMIQDIPTEVYNVTTVEEVLAMDKNQQHRNYHNNYGVDNDLIWGHFHQIRFNEGSLFDSIDESSQEYPFVWSSHHQALDDLGLGIVPIAWSMDGKIIEAIIHEEYANVVGVQFHPEVPSIFKENYKLTQVPFQDDKKSYVELYPRGMGEDFHREFWRYIRQGYLLND